MPHPLYSRDDLGGTVLVRIDNDDKMAHRLSPFCGRNGDGRSPILPERQPHPRCSYNPDVDAFACRRCSASGGRAECNTVPPYLLSADTTSATVAFRTRI